MGKEHTIEVLESHCWQGKIDSEAYRVSVKARKEGKKTIPYNDLSPRGEIAMAIQEYVVGQNLDVVNCEITHISGLEFDGDDEVSYTIKVKFSA